MILILSDVDEPTTDLVINWLLKKDKKFLRISSEDSIDILNIYFENNNLEVDFKVKNRKISTKEITSYWYRRSYFNLKNFKRVTNTKEHSEIKFNNAISNYVNLENLECLRILELSLNRKAKLNIRTDNNISKIANIEIASKCGIKTPKTIITNNKSELKKFFFENNKNIITKPIGDPNFLLELNLHANTTKINEKDLENNFTLSLFQECIQKKFELRIFYLNQTFYSSAVMSQESEKTMLDLKNYNIENPNRILPYKIPIELENKLTNVMKMIGLKSGSIDLAVNTNGEYIFFEVNPVGQFEQVAIPCSYNLFRIISEIL